MEKKGLGRGLGSLFGVMPDGEITLENKQATTRVNDEVKVASATSVNAENKVTNVNKVTEVDGEKVVDIQIKLIDTNPNQPRKNFDATALKELAESIKQHGIIQPIIVNNLDDRYIIVAGERRFRASKIAGIKTIPAIVKNYTEQQVKEIALLENIQREDLNPIEVARALKELLEIYGWTQEVLADRLGKSRPSIANSLRLLVLQPEVISMIECGKLSAGHARSLVVVTDPEVQVKLAKLAVSKKVTVRDLEKTVKELTNPTPKKAALEPSIELKELIEIMQKKFATKVSFMGNDKKGRIFVDYYSSDDLDRILELLKNVK